MARGNATAINAANTGLGNANQSYAALMPELMAESINPPGINPTDRARMDTAAQQGAGGTQAAAVGQGALLEGRTKNPGSARAAIASASRGAGEQLSKERLQTGLLNERLKEQQQGRAQQEMGNIYGTSLGAVAPNVNANTNAINASYDWAKDIMDPLLSAASGPATALAMPRPTPP